ncbi:MAG: hypothetical protein GXX85_11320 [Ignavibacteria bacterium]|nr:hypothetical protein [Ignavibacteria bacterium]
MSRPQASEAAILERNGIALENAVKQPEIASLMEEHGYDSAEIANGKALHEEALKVSRKNKVEGDEATEAYKIYAGIYGRLDEMYSRDRKKAKIVFREDPVTLKKLELTGTIPQAYVAWQKTVSNFYSTLNAESELNWRKIAMKDSELKLLKNIRKLICPNDHNEDFISYKLVA